MTDQDKPADDDGEKSFRKSLARMAGIPEVPPDYRVRLRLQGGWITGAYLLLPDGAKHELPPEVMGKSSFPYEP